MSLGQPHDPQIYHNWQQHLYLKISVTVVSVINLIILYRLQTLGERYSYNINTIISRFRDVRYTFRTHYSMIDGYTHTFVFGRVAEFHTRYSLGRATRLGVTAP